MGRKSIERVSIGNAPRQNAEALSNPIPMYRRFSLRAVLLAITGLCICLAVARHHLDVFFGIALSLGAVTYLIWRFGTKGRKKVNPVVLLHELLICVFAVCGGIGLVVAYLVNH